MKMTARALLSTIFQKIKRRPQQQPRHSAFLILGLFLLSLGLVQVTMGRFLWVSAVGDSAAAAKFDVIITAPKEVWTEAGENIFECYFFSAVEIRGFAFQVANNGETDILCKPYIDNGSNILYRIYMAEEECSEFVVAPSESVEFWLIIAPIGIDTTIKTAELFVDIQQMEGK
jgi:hypothetical protein